MSTPQFTLPSTPDQKQAAVLVKSLTKQAENYQITDEDGFIASWSLVERHDQAIAKIGEWFNPFVDGLYKLHKMAIALRAQFLDPIVASKRALLGERQSYRTKQNRLAQEKADRDAETLRQAQAKELQKEAKKEERAGNVEVATVLREQAKTLPPPVVPVMPATPKQEGSVVKKSWKFRIDNEAIVPNEYRTVDESKIRKVVNALGDKANIAGVSVWEEEKEHSRAVR
jgi:hypothetical protein